MHNVLFVKYVFLATEQAETYEKMCLDISFNIYLFGWKEKMIFKETLTFKL